MLDGMEFLNPKKPIMHYAYDPYYEDDPDIRPVGLHRQICIVYEDDDIVTMTLIDFINSDYRESYEIIPVTTMKLTPDTESLFKISDEYPERFFQWADKFINIIVRYSKVKDNDSGPSCSLAEALEKQDLFINSTLAQLGCNLLWKMFRHGMIEHHGLYLNLSTMKVNPISI